MKNIKNFIKFLNERKYVIGIIIIYILFFIQMQNVFFSADDYAAIFKSNNLKEIFHGISWFFFNWSGRIVGHGLVVYGSSLFGIQFYRILNPFFLFIFSYFISKIINIKNNFKMDKLIFIVSLIILGFDVSINSQMLYWQYSGILYFWGYVPMCYIIYIVFNYYIKKKEITNFQFIKCIACIILINLSMEGTAIFILFFLLILSIYSKIKKENNKKIFLLTISSLIILLGITFIPGNLKRLFESEMSSQLNKSLLEVFSDKFSSYFSFFFKYKGISNFVFLMSIILNISGFKIIKDKFFTFLNIVLISLNMLFFLNFNIFKCSSTNYMVLYIIVFMIYFLLNFILFMKLYKHEILCIALIIAGVISSVFNVVLISYNSQRFYFTLIIAIVIIILYMYNNFTKKEKILYPLLAIFISNYKLGIIFIFITLVIYIFKMQSEEKIITLVTIIFCITNFCNFSVTMYKYDQNAIIHKYNENVIKIAKKQINKNIYLKKLKYNNYSYHVPYENSYIIPWYKKYYEIEDYNLIWLEWNE